MQARGKEGGTEEQEKKGEGTRIGGHIDPTGVYKRHRPPLPTHTPCLLSPSNMRLLVSILE